MTGGIQNPGEDIWKMAWASLYGTRGFDDTGGQAQKAYAAVPGISPKGADTNVGRQTGGASGIVTGLPGTPETEEIKGVPIDQDSIKKPGRISSPKECKTCKERKYQDGSNENVSFKSAQHISPESAGARVRAHEGEHVANAYSKAAESGGKVVQASVSIHTAICPECGRVYVSGGVTNTKISYPNEDNPYQKDRKFQQGMGFRGDNLDLAV